MNAKEDKAYMEWWQVYGEMAEPEIEYPAWKAGRAYQHRFEKEQASQQACSGRVASSRSPELFPAEVSPSAKVTRQSTRR